MGTHKNSSREKWLILAKKIIIQKGVEAINVDLLSKKLGVAKTSFYHFFNSKAEFLDLLFEKGIQDGTDNILRRLGMVQDPKERIQRLTEIVFNENLDNELFLRRLRTYGLKKKEIAKIINETEERRMAGLKSMLIESGMDEAIAEQRSQFFYTYTLGIYERSYVEPSILKNTEKIYSDLNKILYSFQF